MTEFSWVALATIPGAVAAVSLLLTVLKSVIGAQYTDAVNRYCALGLSVAVMVVAVAASTPGLLWWGFLLAALNGVVVCGAILGVTAAYTNKVREDLLGVAPPVVAEKKADDDPTHMPPW
jgi:hypothetical protein